MSVCPIGLAIVLGACGFPQAQQPAAAKAPAAIVERMERPQAMIANPRADISPEDTKRNERSSKPGSNGALCHRAPRPKPRRAATATSCLEKSCPELIAKPEMLCTEAKTLKSPRPQGAATLQDRE